MDDHKLYVMKLVRISTDPAKCQEALREVQVLEALSHPNIVEFKEAFIARDQCNLCIVMAYCESGDLQARIDAAAKDGRPFSEQQAMDWFIQMVLALDYVHKRHILHRDLKPQVCSAAACTLPAPHPPPPTQNVFLTESNKVVKMGDFGVTRMLEHTNAMAQTLIGTPYYMVRGRPCREGCRWLPPAPPPHTAHRTAPVARAPSCAPASPTITRATCGRLA